MKFGKSVFGLNHLRNIQRLLIYRNAIYCVYLVQRFHCREQDDVADGVHACQEHHAAVDADAEAACGRHAVLKGVDEIIVHHARLVVALVAELDLL